MGLLSHRLAIRPRAALPPIRVRPPGSLGTGLPSPTRQASSELEVLRDIICRDYAGFTHSPPLVLTSFARVRELCFSATSRQDCGDAVYWCSFSSRGALGAECCESPVPQPEWQWRKVVKQAGRIAALRQGYWIAFL